MNNLLKMERYHLLRNKFYYGSLAGVFFLGFFTAETYVPQSIGPAGGPARSLADIFNGMIYDSTFLLVILSGILALILGQEFSCRTLDLEICAGHSRKKIFSCKVAAYLLAFNFMAVLYPAAGCLRELKRFGIEPPPGFLYNVVKGVFYSFWLNSSMFLMGIFICFSLRNTAKAVAATAGAAFVLSLYLGYGMMLKLPVEFLPSYQIRAAVTEPSFFQPASLAVGLTWASALTYFSWRKFCGCDLK